MQREREREHMITGQVQDQGQTPYGIQIRMKLELPQVRAGQKASKKDSYSLDPYRSVEKLKNRQTQQLKH